MLLNHKGNTLIESLFALSVYLLIVVYFMSSYNSLNLSRVRLNHFQNSCNEQEIQAAGEGADIQLNLKKALR